MNGLSNVFSKRHIRNTHIQGILPMKEYTYIGEELDLFAGATNWKSYFGKVIGPLIFGNVLEVGSGIGSTSQILCNSSQTSWTCLEPDRKLIGRINERFSVLPLPIPSRIVEGDIHQAPDDVRFDTILYIDVLEHISDDQNELRSASALLNERGRLIVLSPAHEWLYTAFDDAVGHCRRYSKRMLRELAQPAGLEVEKIFYLDCAGLLASAANRLMLRSSMPTAAQLRIWDKGLIPISRVFDPLTFGHVGKSVVAVYKTYYL